MIITRCPLRISLAGGSTDLDAFMDKFGNGSVVSFPCNLYTYIYLQKDRLGYNHDGYYVINYSEKEMHKSIENIQNDIVREALKKFPVDPLGITFYSDIHSTGSGLGSSSSYMNCLLKALSMLKINSQGSDNYLICRLSYLIEKKFNCLLGQQDSYGCGIGGLKKMVFSKSKSPEINFISTNMFEEMYMFLIPTGVTRKSTNVLKTVSFKDNKLLSLVSAMEECLKTNDYQSFHSIINEGWIKKKETSELIHKDLPVKNLDDLLSSDPEVLSHRLCGAGNGGFFLVFTQNKSFNKYNSIGIDIDTDGIVANKL
jgi:D-glycero-alpha-D-manno-heptose-7-phosphate kinase